MKAPATARWPLLVALAGTLVYLNALGNGFALDDVPLVRDNPAIRSPGAIPGLLLSPYWSKSGELSGLYRPATVISLAVNRAVTGAGPFGFHLVNVLLHAAVCALAWFAARRAGVHYGTALVAGLVFAVHPVHTEVVASVAGRADLLAALGTLAAWLAHRRAHEAAEPGARARGFALASSCYLLALLSKENAVLAPLLFLVDDAWRRREPDGRGPRAAAYAGYGLVALVYLGLRAWALGGLRGVEDAAFIDNPAAAGGAAVRMATALWVLARYAWLFVWPARLSADYSFDAVPVVAAAGDLRWLAGLLVAAGVLALGVHGWRRSRPLCLGAAVMVLFLLPGSNLPFAVGTVMAERLLYLPSFGACLVAGHLVAGAAASRAGGSRAARGALIAATLVVLSLLAARTWVRNPLWSDNLTLTLHDVRVSPRSAKLHAGAGIALHAAGRLDEAEPHYRRALEIYPDYAQIRHNFGVLLAARGRYEEAVEQSQRAAALAPDNPITAKALARWLQRLGRHEQALAEFARGVALDPADHRLRFDYARALLAQGGWGRAIPVLADLVRDDPDGVWGGVAAVLVADWRGQTAEALAVCRRLLAREDLTPDTRVEVERLRAALERRAPEPG